MQNDVDNSEASQVTPLCKVLNILRVTVSAVRLSYPYKNGVTVNWIRCSRSAPQVTPYTMFQRNFFFKIFRAPDVGIAHLSPSLITLEPLVLR